MLITAPKTQLIGTDWKVEIEHALDGATIAVLLVSQDFLTSRFIRDFELPPLLDRAESKGLQILWLRFLPGLFSTLIKS